MVEFEEVRYGRLMMVLCDREEQRVRYQYLVYWRGMGGLRWRTLTCVLVYVYAYAIGYSYYRRGELEV